ncbi:MAG: hypothetical protein QNJ06_11290 [Kiloniellales bacterium]|nr:hypothetical protein [Kiloniellales bacterium]
MDRYKKAEVSAGRFVRAAVAGQALVTGLLALLIAVPLEARAASKA